MSNSIQKGNLNSPVVPLTEQQKKVDGQFRKVGELYEKQFLREMMKQMRATVPEGGLIQQSMGEKIFQEQLDQEYVEKWGDSGGIGLSQLIYNSLLDKFGERMGLKAPQQKVDGPVALTEKSNFTARIPMRTSQGLDIQYLKKNQNTQTAGAQDLTSPWDGMVSGVWKMQEGQYLVEVEHDDEMRSQMLFKGIIRPEIGPSTPVRAGQKLGVIDPDSKEVLWRVKGPATDSGLGLAE